MTDWAAFLRELHEQHNVSTPAPARREALAETLAVLGTIPEELESFYRACNGLEYEWFRIFPVYDADDQKRTWNSISRANDASASVYADDPSFLSQFLIFAALSGPDFAAFDRTCSTIWFSEGAEVQKTDLSLTEFIKTCCREVAEL